MGTDERRTGQRLSVMSQSVKVVMIGAACVSLFGLSLYDGLQHREALSRVQSTLAELNQRILTAQATRQKEFEELKMYITERGGANLAAPDLTPHCPWEKMPADAFWDRCIDNSELTEGCQVQNFDYGDSYEEWDGCLGSQHCNTRSGKLLFCLGKHLGGIQGRASRSVMYFAGYACTYGSGLLSLAFGLAKGAS